MPILIRTMILFFIALNTSYAQNIEGVIQDYELRGLEGVYIQNLNSGIHVHTNFNGRFTMHGVEIGDSLQVSHIGYVTTHLLVESLQNEIEIQLTRSIVLLDDLVISSPRRLNALNMITDIDLQIDPVNSSQEVLRKVPGLFIGQHAGGGKAEQLFLRGFDLDHGTDINISVDGIPVNMVSHAHGHGYADLHFLIPETIEKIDFGKGPYYAAKGNFTTAGYVSFKTKDRMDKSSVSIVAGRFNTKRLLATFDLLQSQSHSAYVASEYLSGDGPFESPQNFKRNNWMGKYTGHLSNYDKISILASYFTSQWDASGQIPQRAVDSGFITRFGAIDDTEGGQTNRTNIVLNYDKILDENSSINNLLFYTNYNFELYSNFTFFLIDPTNGDQIRQKEYRDIFGFNSEYDYTFHMGNTYGNLQLGVGLRHDHSKNNELSRTADRMVTISHEQLGDIQETNYNAYSNAEFNFGRWTINPALRTDLLTFNYYDHLSGRYETQTESKVVISPKLNILYNPTNTLQAFIKSGKGFHSNDTRVVIAQSGERILPAAYGADGGFLWKPAQNFLLNAIYWYLYLEQEFVYVGDEGSIEPSGKSRRHGLELSSRYQPLRWLYFDIDANYTLARAMDKEPGEDFLPLSPDFTLASGLTLIHSSGAYGGVKVRYLKDMPANEDNSVIAQGYRIVDLTSGYQWNRFDLRLNIQNLLNTKWRESQFNTKSRLQNEPTAVEEIHFTPGTPFLLKGSLTYNF